MGLFFERSCPVCRHRARQLCSSCRDLLAHPMAVPPAERPDGVDELLVLADYDDVRRIVLAFKADGRRDLARPLGRSLAAAVSDRSPAVLPAVVTWVPAAPDHRAERGYDHGRLLARGVAARLGVPSRRLLSRVGRSRQGLGAAERQAGPSLRAARSVSGTVLLVDDVVTTGASLRAAASALRSAGATSIVAVATARARHEVFTSGSH